MFRNKDYYYIVGATLFLLITNSFFSPVHATGTFQILNFPTSTKVIVGQFYSFYVNFLYSGNNAPEITIIGNTLPHGMSVGSIVYVGAGLYNAQISGKENTIYDYQLTLELTDNYGAIQTQPLDFNVTQALPLNAHATSPTTWECNDGYMSNGIGCQFPANGTFVGGQLRCNAGYVNYQSGCAIAADAANNICYGYTHYSGSDAAGSFGIDGSLICKCDAGYIWNTTMTRCDAASSAAVKTVVSNELVALGSTPQQQRQVAPIIPKIAVKTPHLVKEVSPNRPSFRTAQQISSTTIISISNSTSATSEAATTTQNQALTSGQHVGLFTKIGLFFDGLISKIFKIF